MAYIVKVDDRTFKIDLEREGTRFRVFLNGKPVTVTAEEAGSPSHLSLIVDNKSYDVTVEENNIISVNGEAFRVQVEDERAQQLAKLKGKATEVSEISVTAPMPGLVVDVAVKVGDKVKEGEGLVTVEAMKMQNELKAPQEGVVKEVRVQKGTAVNGGDKLVIIV